MKSLKVNAILNMVKQLLSVLFPLITVPYATRILGATYYGKYSFSYSVASYFILLAGLGIATYAVREGAKLRDQRENFQNFFQEIFSINVISTVFSGICLIISLVFIESLSNYQLLICVHAFSMILSMIGCDWVNTVYEDYFYLTIRYIVFQLIAIVLLFVLVRKPTDYVIYAVVSIVANSGGNIANVIYIKKRARYKFTISGLCKHLKPIFVIFGSTIALTIYVNSDITMLGILKDDYSVGIYSVASKIYTMVKQVLNAVILVTVPRFAMAYDTNKENFNQLFDKIHNILLTVLLPIVLIVVFSSHTAILLFAGEEYISAVKPFQILMLSVFFAVEGCLFVNCVIIPSRREMVYLMATICGALVNILLNFVWIPAYSYYGAAFSTAVSEFLVCLISFGFSKNAVKISVKRETFQCTIISSLIIVLLYGVTDMFIGNSIIRLFCFVTLDVIEIVAVNFIAGNRYFIELINNSKLISRTQNENNPIS